MVYFFVLGSSVALKRLKYNSWYRSCYSLLLFLFQEVLSEIRLFQLWLDVVFLFHKWFVCEAMLIINFPWNDTMHLRELYEKGKISSLFYFDASSLHHVLKEYEIWCWVEWIHSIAFLFSKLCDFVWLPTHSEPLFLLSFYTVKIEIIPIW